MDGLRPLRVYVAHLLLADPRYGAQFLQQLDVAMRGEEDGMEHRGILATHIYPQLGGYCSERDTYYSKNCPRFNFIKKKSPNFCITERKICQIWISREIFNDLNLNKSVWSRSNLSSTYFKCKTLCSLIPSASPHICIKSSRDMRSMSSPENFAKVWVYFSNLYIDSQRTVSSGVDCWVRWGLVLLLLLLTLFSAWKWLLREENTFTIKISTVMKNFIISDIID